MREIKFRIWDTEEMIYPDQNYNFINAVFWNIKTTEAKTINVDTLNYQSLMQFIGLTDKNSIDIYDGDFVKDRFGRIMKIGFWNYRLCFIAISETNFHHADFFDWIENKDYDENFRVTKLNVEIIGNIHQNPELLK